METGTNPARVRWQALVLWALDASYRAYEHDPGVSDTLRQQAQTVLGIHASQAIVELCMTGELPQPGSPGFGRFVDLAAAGDVEIATVVLVREHDGEWAPGGTVAEELRQVPAPKPPAAPISLKDEFTAMGLLGTSPPPTAPAAVRPPRTATPPDAQMAWQPSGRQPADAPPRLTVEIIPTSLHGQNPRTHFGREWWDTTRKAAYVAAGYRCEICGGRGPEHPVELHERYSYDEHARPPVQHVTGLIVLCPVCHAVKHLYRTSAVARETSNPAILDDTLRHLRQVNGWTQQQLDRYLAQVRRDYERREALGPWTADYSALPQNLR